MRYLIGLLLLSVVFGGCVRVPKRLVQDGEMNLSSTDKESLYVCTGQAGDYVEDVTQSKGWVKPKVIPSDDASDLFLWIAGACFVIGIICFSVAYCTHMHSLIVVGFIWIGGGAVAIGIAEIAQYLWILPVALGLGLAFLGWRWKDKHIKNLLTGFKKKDD